MKKLSNITLKYIKASKSRTRMILIGIILSIALITSISIIASSIQNMMIRDVELSSGKQQGVYRYLEPSQIKTLKEHFLLDYVGESIYLGTQNLEGSNSINLYYKDEDALKLDSIELLKGSYPTKENEIALEAWILEMMDITPNIGQEIKIDYQQHTKDKSGNFVEYQGEDTFILSGILKDHPNSKINYIGTGIVSKDYIESNIPEEKINRTTLVTLKKNKSPERTIRDIGEQIGLSEDQIYVNEYLINMQGGNMEANIPFILIGILVVISTIIVIYNMFYISVVERINQFGMFRSLGATPRQIRGLVFNEGLIFSIIGIPIGILCGYILSYLIVPLIPIEGTITMVSSPYTIPIVVVIGLLTIMISVLKPSKLASKVSPIEALRSELLVIKNKSKKSKNHKLGNLFGIMGKMSYENLWRNKKRTWMTIISLTLSCILFIVFSTVFASMNVENLTGDYISSDYMLVGANRGYDGFSEDITKEIDKIEGIDYYNKIKFKKMNLLLDLDALSENFKQKFSYYIQSAEQSNDKKVRINSDVFGYEDSLLSEMKDLLFDGEVPIESMKENLEILVCNKTRIEKTYNVGDKVDLEFDYLVDEKNNIFETITKTFNIVGVVEDYPTGMGFSNFGPQFFIHENIYDKYFNVSDIARLDINVNDDNEKLKNELKQITNDNKGATLKSYKDELEKFEKEKNQMKFLVLTLIIVIAIIGMLNMVNTMITSIISRKKEFGMLRAVGMTNEQLKKMIRLEGMYYGLISAVLSSILGSSAAYGLYNLMKKEATYMTWKFPIFEIVVIFIGVIISSIISTQFGLKRIVNDSIVESIRVTE